MGFRRAAAAIGSIVPIHKRPKRYSQRTTGLTELRGLMLSMNRGGIMSIRIVGVFLLLLATLYGCFQPPELGVETPVNAGLAPVDPDGPDCTGTKVNPFIATDGQRVFLEPEGLDPNAKVLLTGYRYNGQPPTRSNPLGDGREQIYCGCQRAGTLRVEDVDGGTFRTSRFIRVPNDAPSGNYSLEVLPVTADCSVGGIRAVCNESLSCVNPTLTVAPSYITTTMENLIVNTNAEDDHNNPSEMQFLFSSNSGTAFGDGERLVTWSGGFPAGGSGSSHITNADNTSLRARVPLFVGKESQMSAAECREECVSKPGNAEASCTQTCNSNETLGRYNDRLEFAFGGLELDSSPSKAYGVVAGVVTTVAACYVSAQLGDPCGVTGFSGLNSGGAVGIGVAVGAGVNNLLQNDDDNLGTGEASSSLANNDWNVGVSTDSTDLAGQSTGDIVLQHRNQRIASPSILEISVKLNSIKINESYEKNNCTEPNEVFLNARAFLYTGQSGMSSPIRIPAGDDSKKLLEGETWSFGPTEGFLVNSGRLPSENAPDSPFVYVEIGVWELDDSRNQKDLIGIATEIHYLAPVISNYSEAIGGFTEEGFFTREANYSHSARVHGYAGSDNHCLVNNPFGIGANDWDPQAEEGRATVKYDLKVTWLKTPVD